MSSGQSFLEAADWGSLPEWAGALLTGLSLLGAAIYYVIDRRRERRTQATSVLVWLHPYEHRPPTVKMQNMSDKPVFDHGFLVTSRSQGLVAKKAREGWNHKMFAWPEENKFTYRDQHTLLNFHDGSELYLSPGIQVDYDPELQYNSVVYDYYAYFRDAAGQYWVVDARTQRPVNSWRRWRLKVGPGGIEAS